MTGQGTGPVTPLYQSNQIPGTLLWPKVPQSLHDYAPPLITINLPLTNFLLCASATYANIVRIRRNTTKATDRLTRAD